MKALLVDLDDTLLDYSGGVDECWLEACEALAGPAGIDPAGLVAAIVETRRWFWSDPGRHRTRAHRHAARLDAGSPRTRSAAWAARTRRWPAASPRTSPTAAGSA